MALSKGDFSLQSVLWVFFALLLQSEQILHVKAFLSFAVYFKIKNIKKDPTKALVVRKFIGWWIDKHYLQHPDEKIVMMFDMTDAGLSNVVSRL